MHVDGAIVGLALTTMITGQWALMESGWTNDPTSGTDLLTSALIQSSTMIFCAMCVHALIFASLVCKCILLFSVGDANDEAGGKMLLVLMRLQDTI